MTWTVKAKVTGAAEEASTAPTICHTPEHVAEIFREFRAKGFQRVWIEDVGGREISPGTFGIDEEN